MKNMFDRVSTGILEDKGELTKIVYKERRRKGGYHNGWINMFGIVNNMRNIFF